MCDPFIIQVKKTGDTKFLNLTMSRLSLLLHESKTKLRTTVNNNDNYKCSGIYVASIPVLLMCILSNHYMIKYVTKIWENLVFHA